MSAEAKRRIRGKKLLEVFFKQDINPKRCEQSDHEPNCYHFSVCLEVASLLGWPGMSCRECPRRTGP
jgi:hypothetical protein